MIITEYLQLQKAQEELYGERTIVLMQVGSFYEIWEYDPSYCTDEKYKRDNEGKIWTENIGHAIETSVILNCVLTHEDNNKPYGISSPHKIGFPVISYQKNLTTLLANGYTVVRVDQDKSGKFPSKREIAEVCSPTMEIDNIAPNRITNNIVAIYIEYQKNNKKIEKCLITTGVAMIDILTGNCKVCEFYSKIDDEIHATQELYRFLISHYPRELIIHLNDIPEDEATYEKYTRYLEKVLELKRFERVTTFINKTENEYKKVNYQIELFNKIYKPDNNVIISRNENIIQNLSLDMVNYGRIAFVILLQHIYSYNKDIFKKLNKPDTEWIDEQKHLILTHNAILQLDIISNEKNMASSAGGKKGRNGKNINSLLAVLDQNQTQLGKRLLANILQNPLARKEDIEVYYNMIEEFLRGDLWMTIAQKLKELPDIAKLQRKLGLRTITPKELSLLFNSYIKIIEICIIIIENNLPVTQQQMLTNEDIGQFNEFMEKYGMIINFKNMECCVVDDGGLNFKDLPINSGIYEQIDNLYNNNKECLVGINRIVEHLNGFLGKTSGKKIEVKEGCKGKKKQGAVKNENTCTIITTTEAKCKTLGKSQVNKGLCGEIEFVLHTGTERLITSPIINQLCDNYDTSKKELKEILKKLYDSILEDMNNGYKFYLPVANFIAKIDLIQSYCNVTKKYNYYRPTICEGEGGSFLEAEEIRHPIIERIIEGEFIANDVMIGNGGNENRRSNGLLLYGVNQSGKSSLAKAIGLNIIMAQAGCYVPSKLRFAPYKKLITRLSGADNIFKGQSSFAVEMEELRTILRQANCNTLVIGDELSRGSESHSGMAITTSAILKLLEKGSTFIFATHMHELLNLSYIKNLTRAQLNISHLSISYNEKLDMLIYDRKLQSGAGLSLYGIIVAKSLDLPEDFINTANQVLMEITGENDKILNTKQSKYNAKVYMDQCAICQKTAKQTQLHTHHIRHQNESDKNGLIGNIHKNSRNNLIVLCETCHTNLHKGGNDLLSIDTTNGHIVLAI